MAKQPSMGPVSGSVFVLACLLIVGGLWWNLDWMLYFGIALGFLAGILYKLVRI
ncbi:hypothetical protein HY642_03575 [Candidatus Woesearchaeota archaeon]|nr:hypothetical protein [Candidatus Woesearchaeota archaeon]